MIWLLLSILTFSFMMLLFKYFEKKGIHHNTVIIFNYLTAGICALLFYEGSFTLSSFTQEDFFPYAIAIGFMFVTIMFLIVKCTLESGIAIATTANKMSVVIPVIIALFFYNDTASIMKVTGITLSLLGVYLVTTNSQTSLREILLPAAIFLSSGILDSVFNYAQRNFVNENNYYLFIATIFISAAIIGVPVLLAMKNERMIIRRQELLSGLVMGIPNFFTVYFLLKALDTPGLQSSMVFPVNNVGVVLVTTIGAVVFFKEKLFSRNSIGVAFCIVALFLIARS